MCRSIPRQRRFLGGLLRLFRVRYDNLSLMTCPGFATTVSSSIVSREKSRFSPTSVSTIPNLSLYEKTVRNSRYKGENLDFPLETIELETVVVPSQQFHNPKSNHRNGIVELS